MSTKDDFLYDVRITERHIQDGALTKEDYEKHLKGLPDVEEKGELLVIEEDIVEDEEVEAVEAEQAQEDETE